MALDYLQTIASHYPNYDSLRIAGPWRSRAHHPQGLRTLREADYIYTPVPVSRKGRHASKAAEMMLSLGIREEQINSTTSR